jgi:hypothetical protein
VFPNGIIPLCTRTLREDSTWCDASHTPSATANTITASLNFPDANHPTDFFAGRRELNEVTSFIHLLDRLHSRFEALIVTAS